MTAGLATALAVVLGVAVAGKLSRDGFAEFRLGVGRLWFGPGRLSPGARHVLAVLVLTAEVVVTAALAAGGVLAVLDRTGAAASGFAGAGALFAVFTVAHAVTVAGRQAVPCACFGRTETVVGPLTLARTAALLALAVAGLVLAPTGADPAPTGGQLLGVPAGAVLGLLLIGLEDIAALFRPTPVRTGPRVGT